MNTTVFELINPKARMTDPVFGSEETIYCIPTLPAYSIIDCTLDYQDLAILESGNSRPEFFVHEDNIVVRGTARFWGASGKNRLIVHYAGIRDYALLFPSIEDSQRRTRLGQYAEEVEKSLESGAWMSLIVMAGAVIEGILGTYTDRYRFDGMIKEARNRNIITAKEESLCTSIKNARNQIHAGELNVTNAGRSLGMDTYLMYDTLIKRHWGKMNLI